MRKQSAWTIRTPTKYEAIKSKIATMVNQMTGVHDHEARRASFPAVSVRAAKAMIWK